MSVFSAPPYTRAVAEPFKGRPWTPEGHLTLREALLLFGKERIGDAWTGEELWARHRIFGPPQPPKKPEQETAIQVRRGEEITEIVSPVRYVVDNKSTLIPYDEALERYENEKDDLYDMWRKEAAAFQRYLAACSQFRQVLHATHVSAFILTNHGNTEPVPERIWSGNTAGKVFDSGKTRFSTGNTYSPVTVEGIVLIPQANLEIFLSPTSEDETRSAPPEADKQEFVASSAEPTPTMSIAVASAGGRPAKWDWEACWVQTCVRVYLDGVPETQAELVRDLQTWFVEEYGDAPSDSQIKERASRLFRALREAENS